MGGSVNYYTHYAYTSAGSMTEAMQSAETLIQVIHLLSSQKRSMVIEK